MLGRYVACGTNHADVHSPDATCPPALSVKRRTLRANPAFPRVGVQTFSGTIVRDAGAGLIDNQIRAALLSARFVISDLTRGSYGAYWEAGFGEGRGIPVIYTCAKGEWDQNKTHFDTNHMLTIIWDVDNFKLAENALVAAIRATLRTEAKQTDDEDPSSGQP